MKVNLLVSFDIEPVVTHKPSTGKSDTVGTRAVDDRELQIATERCGIYQFPIHDGYDKSPIKPTTSVI